MALIVRRAEPEDADAAIEVRRRSITDLCVTDHRSDPATLEDWVGNRTADDFAQWCASNYLAIAEISDEIVGLGAIHLPETGPGLITLLYVHPDFVGQGAGSALLARLESEAIRARCSTIELETTKNAKSFYIAHGFEALNTDRSPGRTGIWLAKAMTL